MDGRSAVEVSFVGGKMHGKREMNVSYSTAEIF